MGNKSVLESTVSSNDSPAVANTEASEAASAAAVESAAVAKPAIAPKPPAPPPKVYDLFDHGQHFELIAKEDEKRIRAEIAKHVEAILLKHKLGAYTALFLYDSVDSIAQYHADQIYEAAAAAGGAKDILLILHSRGGSVEPAYFIGKICARLAKQKFVVAVPRRAKSAATVVALAADEIHMGIMSELGPVDPQFDGYPALGLINSINVLAEVSCKHKEAAEMLARFLHRTLDLRQLGYFVRVPESAVQYAERLLKRNEAKLPKGSTAHSVADQLVNHYKDHGFVIDIDEAKSVLGSLVHVDTPEYRASNEIYTFIDWMEFLLRALKKKDYWFVGAMASGGSTRDVAKK